MEEIINKENPVKGTPVKVFSEKVMFQQPYPLIAEKATGCVAIQTGTYNVISYYQDGSIEVRKFPIINPLYDVCEFWLDEDPGATCLGQVSSLDISHWIRFAVINKTIPYEDLFFLISYITPEFSEWPEREAEHLIENLRSYGYRIQMPKPLGAEFVFNIRLYHAYSDGYHIFYNDSMDYGSNWGELYFYSKSTSIEGVIRYLVNQAMFYDKLFKESGSEVLPSYHFRVYDFSKIDPFQEWEYMPYFTKYLQRRRNHIDTLSDERAFFKEMENELREKGVGLSAPEPQATGQASPDPQKKKNALTEEETREKAISMFQNGQSRKYIRNKLSVDKTTLNGWIRASNYGESKIISLETKNEIVSRFKEGMPIGEIRKQLNFRSSQAIRMILEEEGQDVEGVSEKTIVDLYKGGTLVKDICTKCGVSTVRIYDVLHKNNIELRG